MGHANSLCEIFCWRKMWKKRSRVCDIFCFAESDMKSTHRRSNFTRRRRISHREAVFHPPERVDFVEKSTCLRKCFFLVGEGGFEPPKALLTDLQSAPFGHSGIPPNMNLSV